MEKKKKPHQASPGTASNAAFDSCNPKSPIIGGQCAKVLPLIRQHQSGLSFFLMADNAIPEAAARVHDLRGMGFNIRGTIVPEWECRGVTHRTIELYSLGSPEWPAPGFLVGQF